MCIKMGGSQLQMFARIKKNLWVSSGDIDGYWLIRTNLWKLRVSSRVVKIRPESGPGPIKTRPEKNVSPTRKRQL
ncbi:unnamed protein product [Meloidogyne enterolobii]|uniref:Uncharacterized protein n=1 Tax=Meloidogyne enterolobii TaxID=390850 RepID=A0ACB0Y5U7_MELEN